MLDRCYRHQRYRYQVQTMLLVQSCLLSKDAVQLQLSKWLERLSSHRLLAVMGEQQLSNAKALGMVDCLAHRWAGHYRSLLYLPT
jgi:hypothetical protein